MRRGIAPRETHQRKINNKHIKLFNDMVTRLTKGRLKVTISETRAELGEVAAREVGAYIRSLLETQPEVNIIFASAPSQNDFLANLLLEEIDWSRVNAFHMDEYIGIDPHAPQAFGQFLRDRIFSKKTFKSVNYIDPKAADPAAECERYAGLLRQMIGFLRHGTHLLIGDSMCIPAEIIQFWG